MRSKSRTELHDNYERYATILLNLLCFTIIVQTSNPK
uniref:Uncharacterized protein n=1 Tax=Anguilla anguilla TaxID=7936 RepID=A0A0E9V536_ANGAN